MCGICGKLNHDRADRVDPDLVDRMIGTIRHRGPDGHGKYVSGPVALGHARLTVIDLNTGAQPITNEDGTLWLVYNGEIYNFPELREELIAKGHVFTSTTDSEVIVHLYEEMGVECVKRLRGMFAFALWDEREGQLFCARDRTGIKPFYYSENEASFSFGSEIKALIEDKDVKRDVDLSAIDSFLTFLYLPGEETLFRSVRKLLPGYYIVVKNGAVLKRRYWDLAFEKNVDHGGFEAASKELRRRVKERVKDHMISDVPVGVLLSGGVDSTIILGSAAEETSKPIHTYTIGFEGAGVMDERPYAEIAAKKFGTNHHSMTISAKEFTDFIEDYVWHMEEPVSEPAAVALHYLSKLASKEVKVLLSGEGADEGFAGYREYSNFLTIEKIKRRLGRQGSGALSRIMRTAGRLDKLNRLYKYSPMLETPFHGYFFSRRSSPFRYFNRNKGRLYRGGSLEGLDQARHAEAVEGLLVDSGSTDMLCEMLYVDTKIWLPDNLLVKADKMTMANSIELRVPFLDHTILEYAGSLPADFKMKGYENKRILKAAFADMVPEEILNRQKMGFPTPIQKWMRVDLKDYIRDILLSERCLSRGYFDRSMIEELLEDNFSGKAVTTEVFSMLVLELWFRKFSDSQVDSRVEASSFNMHTV